MQQASLLLIDKKKELLKSPLEINSILYHFNILAQSSKQTPKTFRGASIRELLKSCDKSV